MKPPRCNMTDDELDDYYGIVLKEEKITMVKEFLLVLCIIVGAILLSGLMPWWL